jgi:hypothetical protein
MRPVVSQDPSCCASPSDSTAPFVQCPPLSPCVLLTTGLSRRTPFVKEGRKNIWTSSVGTNKGRKIATVRLENAQQLISRFPDDILFLIFDIAAETFHSTKMKLSISQVCHAWRSAAFAHKRYWSSIELSRPLLAIEFMDRARPAPFALRLHKQGSTFARKEGMQDMVRALKRAMARSIRIEEIVFRTSGFEAAFKEHILPVLQLKPSLGSLKRVVVDFGWVPDWSSEKPPPPASFEPPQFNVRGLVLDSLFQHQISTLGSISFAECDISFKLLRRYTPTHLELGALQVKSAEFLAFLREVGPELQVLRMPLAQDLAEELANQDVPLIPLPKMQKLHVIGAEADVLPVLFAILDVCIDAIIILETLVWRADLDDVAGSLAELVSRHYSDGADDTQYSVSWAAQGPYRIRFAPIARGPGCFIIRSPSLYASCFPAFCSRLEHSLRNQITLLRVRGIVSTTIYEQVDDSHWKRLQATLEHVQSIYISVLPADWFLEDCAASGLVKPRRCFLSLSLLHVHDGLFSGAVADAESRELADSMGEHLADTCEYGPIPRVIYLHGTIEPSQDLLQAIASVECDLYHQGRWIAPDRVKANANSAILRPRLNPPSDALYFDRDVLCIEDWPNNKS